MTFQPLALPAARVVDLIAARSGRDMDRGRQAAAKVRAAGGSAMDAALAQIGTAHDEAARHNAFKLQVLHWIRRGPEHPAVRARFGARAWMLRGQTLAGAIVLVERWYREERKALQIAMALGGGSFLSVDILRELRLILRVLRFAGQADQFAYLVATVLRSSQETELVEERT
jgi:hypothetical protein